MGKFWIRFFGVMLAAWLVFAATVTAMIWLDHEVIQATPANEMAGALYILPLLATLATLYVGSRGLPTAWRWITAALACLALPIIFFFVTLTLGCAITDVCL